MKHSRQKMLETALQHLQSGLDLLDGASAPGHIGAHVDLALHELDRVVSAGMGPRLVCLNSGSEGIETLSLS